jgi:hypothetical protein
MARLLLRERRIIAEERFAEIVIWQVPRPLRGSRHRFKYRLAFVVNEVCVLRFDNETARSITSMSEKPKCRIASRPSSS